MEAVIYARYSCDNQREESIDGQLRECKAFAERKGLKIVGTYIDRAFSAKTDNRPEFQRMIKESNKRFFKTVIVWKLDRFSRSRYDSARYKAILRKNEVKVVSATEVISDGAEGILMEAILEGYAEYYSAELSEKVIRGMKENALKCKYNGGLVAIGYTVDKDNNYHLDPLVAPLIKEAFEMYSNGKMIKDILAYLNDNGVRNGSGNLINKSSIVTMLKNVKYKGQYKYRDVVIDNGVPRIVSDELFDKVQERLKKNKHSRSRFKAKVEYYLSTKLICGYCGELLVGESGKGRGGATYNYYKCSGVKHHNGCKKKSLRKAYIEDLIINEVVEKMFTEDMISAIADSVMNLQKQENTVLPLLQRELEETKSKIDNLIRAMEMGMLTQSTKDRFDELELQRQQIETEIIKQEIQEDLITREQIIEWLKAMKKLDLSLGDSKRKLIDTFVNSILVYDDKLVVGFNYKERASTLALSNYYVSFCKELGAPHPPAGSLPAGGVLSLTVNLILHKNRKHLRYFR